MRFMSPATAPIPFSTPIEVIGVAEDEASAIGWLTAHGDSCDLVIVDIFLRNGTGIGVLKGIGAVAGDMKRIVLSNHATSDVRDKCLELGASEVFDKSNQLDDLLLYCNRLQAPMPA